MNNRESISRGRPGARLVAASVLDFTNVLSATYSENYAIEFPAMPDTIDLIRSTDYAVTYNPVLPDGVHVYRGTRPMEIPFAFKLHAFDDNYCPQGALTLLKTAARLHAFLLPVGLASEYITTPIGKTAAPPPSPVPFLAPVTISAPVGGDMTDKVMDSAKDWLGTAYDFYFGRNAGKKVNSPSKGAKADDEQEKNSSSAETASGELAWRLNDMLRPPRTAILHLIWLGPGMPGLSCVGYVKEATIKFHGPWMRGPNGSYNLPTMGEYSFVFVNKPGHNNSWQMADSASQWKPSAQVAFTSNNVLENLYNTFNLAARLKTDSAPVRAQEPVNTVTSRSRYDVIPTRNAFGLKPSS